MKLTSEQIKSIARGACRVTCEDGRICLSRLTEAQEAMFRSRSDFLAARARAGAGIRLVFRTDSRALTLTAKTCAGSASDFFAFDVFVNGRFWIDFTSEHAEQEAFCGSCELGDGIKDVCIYFPWSARAELISLELDDGCSLEPISPSKKMLCFGDSITQGAIARHPSRTYASRLADALDAEGFNKAIAGDVFYAPYATLAEEGDFDYVTVAYGTNDWKKETRESFVQNATAFYRTLSQKYPSAKIFAITPIWRADPDRITEVGSFFFVRDTIKEIVRDLKNVTLIDAFDFVPKDPSYFTDLRLHPNDLGFDCYADALIAEIKSHL